MWSDVEKLDLIMKNLLSYTATTFKNKEFDRLISELLTERRALKERIEFLEDATGCCPMGGVWDT